MLCVAMTGWKGSAHGASPNGSRAPFFYFLFFLYSVCSCSCARCCKAWRRQEISKAACRWQVCWAWYRGARDKRPRHHRPAEMKKRYMSQQKAVLQIRTGELTTAEFNWVPLTDKKKPSPTSPVSFPCAISPTLSRLLFHAFTFTPFSSTFFLPYHSLDILSHVPTPLSTCSI